MIVNDLMTPRRNEEQDISPAHDGSLQENVPKYTHWPKQNEQEQQEATDYRALARACHRPVNRWHQRTLFPLTNDHLITLTQFNVFRAIATNIHILTSFDGFMGEPPSGDCTDSDESLPLFPKPSECHGIPETLKPTSLQRTMSHKTWIEPLPHPQMRDNAILAGSTIDFQEFKADIMGGLYPDGSISPGTNGLLVWLDPWHPRGWEFTEGFARKWRVLLAGCDDLLRYTNYWRATRDEPPLVLEHL
jgi:hypothetical protein